VIEAVKEIIRQTTGLPDPVLHALIGLGVYGLSVAVLRQSLRSWVPWLIVLGLQLINEAADIVHDWLAYSDIEVRGTFWDTVITMCLPTMLVVCARFVRPPAAGQRS
jgi:hypothetical protein